MIGTYFVMFCKVGHTSFSPFPPIRRVKLTCVCNLRGILHRNFGPIPYLEDVYGGSYLLISNDLNYAEGIFKVLLPKKDYFSRALYTVDIGQNDLTAENFLSKTPEEAAAATTNLMNQFTTSIKAIYDEGARWFWIHNTGPIGCLAYVLSMTNFTESQIDKAGCAIPWNDIAQNFNKRLNETVVQLRKDLPLAAFTYVDVFSVKYSLFSHAERLGFKQPLVVCCGSGGKYNFGPAFCGFTVAVNGTKLTAESCQDPSVKINWDGVHYTEAANKWVFDQIANGAFSDPPIPLKMACKK